MPSKDIKFDREEKSHQQMVITKAPSKSRGSEVRQAWSATDTSAPLEAEGELRAQSCICTYFSKLVEE